MTLQRTANFWIAVVTAACWAIAAILGMNDQATIALGFIPIRWSGAVMAGPAVPAVLTPLSATLVHGGLLHLAFNLLVLVWCGKQVERVLGAGALVFIYIVSAYTAAAVEWLVAPHAQVPMVGASGAISGIVGAFALMFGQQKQIVRSRGLNRMLNALWLLVAWIVLQLMTGALAGFEGVLVATPAHVGGFLAGLLMQRPLLLWRYRKA